MIQKLWKLKITRFLCVGIFNTIVDFIILNSLAFIIGIPVIFSNLISVCFGVTLSYILNHYIVFRHKYPVSGKSYFKFFIITGISVLMIQSAVITILSPLISYELTIISAHLRYTTGLIEGHNGQLTVNIAKIIAVLMGMAWNYILYSRVVFKNSEIQLIDTE